MSGSSLRAAACLDITIKVPPPQKTKMSSASHCPSHPGCLRVKKKKKSFPLKFTFLRHSLVTVLGRGRAAFSCEVGRK